MASIFGDVLGAVLGFSSAEKAEDAAAQRNQANIDAQNAMAERNERLQREFAQMGVRWRVEDAKAAGLHPLYALGGAGAAYTPSAMTVSGGSGGEGDRMRAAGIASLSRLGDALERKMFEAEVESKRADAAKDFAMASAVDSLSATSRQAQMASSPWVLPVVSPTDDVMGDPGTRWREVNPGFAADAIKREPVSINSVRSETPYIEAGPAKAGHQEAEFGYVPGSDRKFRALVPAGSSIGEGLESLSESKLLMGAWIGMNVEHYGAGWLYDAAKFMPVLGQFLVGAESVGQRLAQGVHDAMDVAAPRFDELGHRASGWVGESKEWLKRSREATRARTRVPKWPYGR